MKEFFTDFLMLLANSVLIICFALMSFLLISNFYHSGEVSYKYYVDLNESADYKNYQKVLKQVDKKMNSVNFNDNSYAVTAKPIYEYYQGCVNALSTGTFSKLDGNTGIGAMDIYNANSEILKVYNNKCIFYISYNIENISKKDNSSLSFDKTKKLVSQKSDLILKNAEYLTDSGLGNSSYGFTTENTRGTIYNKISNELDLTINNYEMIAYLLDDIADWYVAEYGGNA